MFDGEAMLVVLCLVRVVCGLSDRCVWSGVGGKYFGSGVGEVGRHALLLRGL